MNISFRIKMNNLIVDQIKVICSISYQTSRNLVVDTGHHQVCSVVGYINIYNLVDINADEMCTFTNN